VAALAKKYGKRVIAFCGAIDQKGEAAACPGIDAIFPIPTGAHTLAEAMDITTATRNLRITAEQVFRVIALYQA
jgi:glycerate kinase